MSTTRILLADADEEFRLMLTDVINNEPDMEVTASTGDGAEALQLLTANVADVLIMDLVLGGMDGLDLLRQLSEVSFLRRPNILVLSGFIRAMWSIRPPHWGRTSS